MQVCVCVCVCVMQPVGGNYFIRQLRMYTPPSATCWWWRTPNRVCDSSFKTNAMPSISFLRSQVRDHSHTKRPVFQSFFLYFFLQFFGCRCAPEQVREGFNLHKCACLAGFVAVTNKFFSLSPTLSSVYTTDAYFRLLPVPLNWHARCNEGHDYDNILSFHRSRSVLLPATRMLGL